MMTRLEWLPTPVRPLVQAAVAAARADPRILGLALGGSAAAGLMDEYSDLDFVVVARDADHPNLLREAPAFAATLGPLLSAFTGEHVGEPRLLLCLYGPPPLRVDLQFIADHELDRRVEDGRILWQRAGALDSAFRRAPALWPRVDPQWLEDRFWTWLHNGVTKVGRGELFACLEQLAFLRRTVFGPLIAERRGHRPDGVRRIEAIAPELVPAMAATIGDPTAAGCVRALRAAVDLYQRLRGWRPEGRGSGAPPVNDWPAPSQGRPVVRQSEWDVDFALGQHAAILVWVALLQKPSLLRRLLRRVQLVETVRSSRNALRSLWSCHAVPGHGLRECTRVHRHGSGIMPEPCRWVSNWPVLLDAARQPKTRQGADRG